jgi:hypothetical protein
MPWHDVKLSAIPDASHRLIEARVGEWSNDKGVDSGGSRAGAGTNACKSCRIVIQPDRFVSAAKRIRRDEAVRRALHYADAITRRAAGLGFRKGARSS